MQPITAEFLSGREKRKLKWHELQNRTFEHQDWNEDSKERLSGYDLLDKAFKKVDGQKLTVLCLSSLQDISEYLDKQDDEFIQDRLAKLVSQGGYEFHDGSIMPDMKAMNNKFHPEAAKSVADRLNKLAIPSDAWGREVALAAPLARTFLEDLPGPVGHHLRCVSSRQDFVFGWDARHKPFMPHLDEKWLFRGLGMDPDSETPKQMMEQRIPVRELMKLGTFPAYDACAAMGALGDDVLQCLGILGTTSGVPDSQSHPMETFIKGSLQATYELAEMIIPSDTIQYYTPNYNISWDIFQQQMLHLEKLEAFKRTKGITTEDIKKFTKNTFGDNKLRDDSGNLIKDLHGEDCPMIPTTMPYEQLYELEGVKLGLQEEK
ncbi:hypothetical protein B0I35DRAFT_482670 [Stachybotrys elegans]|uniref:Uncharacterized protein n=1 Tax=Stachybotrys elegans TaxID=80388 RepID=A0A8K0SMI8_9HYPO|nr:hypothetical protein B0I35DRAFT_482670 [Stachybotrys elegans]